jgi:hypothetical protein
MTDATAMNSESATAERPSCMGFLCLDRDECFHYDEKLKHAAFIHDGASCDNTIGDVLHRFRYQNVAGDVQMLR